ncbi:unnamed protein product [Dibothriocephalus latus]|uniref:BACK domain-containing protein n=1 Tax=Dibothriocephalus latus TaxID=60516 RepID=A0A3P7PD13_DIBLA|nr:unnamed protein product [Dibothriocephalus latus]
MFRVATSFLDYIYTGQLEINEDNAAGLLMLSRNLKFLKSRSVQRVLWPPDTVLSLLQADDLQVKIEERVLEAIGRWISPLSETDDARIVHAETMMKEVRWNQVDADFR